MCGGVVVAALPSPQTPFALSPLQELKDELIGKIPPQQLLQIEQDWIKIEQKHGLEYIMNELSRFKSEFDYTSTRTKPSSYSIDISSSSKPELLGFDSVKQYSGYFNVDNKDKNYFLVLKVEMIQNRSFNNLVKWRPRMFKFMWIIIRIRTINN